MNSGFCTQTRSQERSAVRALGPGQGSLWGLGLKMGHAEERWQVLEALLWPWLWCTDTGWLMSKCGFITGVAEAPVNQSEGPQVAVYSCRASCITSELLLPYLRNYTMG